MTKGKVSEIIRFRVVNFDIPPKIIRKLLLRTKVDKEKGCWLYNEDWSQYGRIKVNDRYESAHRVSYWIFKRKPTSLVCHTCDRPGCINPKHLFEGTYKDNSQDALKKGRLRVYGRNIPKKPKMVKVIEYKSLDDFDMEKYYKELMNFCRK